MRFSSIYPTDIPDDHAAALLAVLADRWADVPAAQLARALARGSVYVNELPEAYGMHLSKFAGPPRYGVLLQGIGEVEPVQADVNDHLSFRFSVVAATTPEGLASAWSHMSYHRPPAASIEAAARAYREHHGESPEEALSRARAAEQ